VVGIRGLSEAPLLNRIEAIFPDHSSDATSSNGLTTGDKFAAEASRAIYPIDLFLDSPHLDQQALFY